jgi:dTDP-glucose pyrophosphorylase
MSYCWRNILTNDTQSIKEVLRLIDLEALRIVLIVDEKSKLLGIVTDGDIRRGLIRGVGLAEPVSLVMNTDPTLASVDMSKQQIINLMEAKDILSIPLVDSAGIVVGLQTLRDAIVPEVFDNPIFIMAGGFGTRLRPLTDHCPKPMLEVGKKPMLERLIEQFKKYGFHDFYLSTHYLPHVIKDYFGDGSRHGVSIKYVHEETPLGTGGALGLLPEDLPDLPVLMINGDVLTSLDFSKAIKFHNATNADATMCVREYEYQVPYGVIEGEGERVERMVEKPMQRFFINAGIYVVNKEIVCSVSRNEKIDMPSLLERHIKNDKIVNKYPMHEYWLDIGRVSDFERAQIDIHTLGMD